MASVTIFHDCQPVPTFANHHNFNTTCFINMQSCIHIHSDSLLWFCFQLVQSRTLILHLANLKCTFSNALPFPTSANLHWISKSRQRQILRIN